MSKLQPNLEMLHDKVLEFNEAQPDEYFDSITYYLSENSSQIHNIFDNLANEFANDPLLFNALKVVFLLIYRVGAPAFFGLEDSRIPELQLDPTTQKNEVLELKRITKYCLNKFQKMQTSHEIPNIGRKYSELCQLTQEEIPIADVQLTEFEQQYAELAVKFDEIEQRIDALLSECEERKPGIDNTKAIQLLEQIDSLMIQPDHRFKKAENELILNFFHERYTLINKVYNGFPGVAQDYQRFREQKKAKQGKIEKTEDESSKQNQELPVQNIKDFTSFLEGSSLSAFPESMTIEYKDYIYPFRDEELRKKLRATICAFLNTNGGRIFIGVNNTGFRVKGLFLTTNDQDALIRDIDSLLKDFHPKVDPEEVTTTFVPIKKKENTYKPGFYVVKIIVKKGKPNELYFAGRDCYKRRNGQNDIQMPSNFKKEIIDRFAITTQTHPDLFKDKGDFNDPPPETGNPVANIKAKRVLDTKPQRVPGPKQKQNIQPISGFTKLVIRNVQSKADAGDELRAFLDKVPPLNKTLNFTKDETVLNFSKAEEARAFLEYVEGNPIVFRNNALQFVPKTAAEKEKPEKNTKVRVDVEEEKKDLTKVRAESSNTIWVRNIPENTSDLKEKLITMLGEYSSILKDIKIHNKKKRATLEFESAAQANQVFAFLNFTERFLGENKVTFEKASPPSSPNFVTKPQDRNIDSIKPKEGNKAPESTKLREPRSNNPGALAEGSQVESNILKISNVPLDETSQDLAYLVKACNHHIKKSIDKKITKTYILFRFKEKEDAVKAYNFLIQNNFSFQGKNLKIEYLNNQERPGPISSQKSLKNQTGEDQTDVAQIQPKSEFKVSDTGAPQIEPRNEDFDLLVQKHLDFQQNLFSNQTDLQNNSTLLNTQGGAQITPGFTMSPESKDLSSFQSENTVDQYLKQTEMIEPENINLDIQQSDNLSNAAQLQGQLNQAIQQNQVYQNMMPISQQVQVRENQTSLPQQQFSQNSVFPNTNAKIQTPGQQGFIQFPGQDMNQVYAPMGVPTQNQRNQTGQSTQNLKPATPTTKMPQDAQNLSQANRNQYSPQLPQQGSTQPNVIQQVPIGYQAPIGNQAGLNQLPQSNIAQSIPQNFYNQFPHQFNQVNQQFPGQFPVNKNMTQPSYQQDVNAIQGNAFNSQWAQGQTQTFNQQQFPNYSFQNQQFNTQAQYLQPNLGSQAQFVNPQSQYVTQQGQFPGQQGQFPLQAGQSSQKQLSQTSSQNQSQTQMQSPLMGSYQNFGVPYYQGYPSNQMPSNFQYGQLGYNQAGNLQNRSDVTYQNIQGSNIQGGSTGTIQGQIPRGVPQGTTFPMQATNGSQALTPQQLQQLLAQQQQQQMGFAGGQNFPQSK